VLTFAARYLGQVAGPANAPPPPGPQHVGRARRIRYGHDAGQRPHHFAGKRLAVVTAGSGSNAAWLSAQDDLATLSTNAIHRVVSGATHASLLEAENDAGVSSRAIRDVVASVRTHQPLPTS
jgi:hypothetical protein